ncbi:glycosyltransferase family 39 protein [Legionella pneumophila serogroup 1]|uniref:glycosyltransferase family 39 protein n=1 Tax=Legionella pneumophila TaxID=446 RepID=UPI00077077A3|nr:glycosyltransferase family 39 protein [Legionella pneumophila]MCW8435496.1 glycosyltransferase family 39 protein [Legionella pneumophila]WAI64420.1 glycosyltransferase family 39 protein [Legionella pneumophila]WAI67407.1 glycosyltransferase family 39 protein [Legionella pneumophila]CZG57626.1 Dolichyl-phosphate-mannose-protein mannosyltransferase [Legionella pneumophila]CZH81205.1 Dolichyl-phosphate-mannose-protein mannosyltransferase [Legionella pneumophila]
MKFLKKTISQWDTINLAICGLFSLLLIIWSFDQYLANDSYYYWRWSQNLDWSYYDGPPLIAYFIRFCTTIFSDSNLTLALINKFMLLMTCIVIYTTARLNLNKSASIISAMVCLFFPLSISSICRGTTYDVPQLFFYACSLYCATLFAKDINRYKNLYATAAAIGLLMLSKYSGVILVLGLLCSIIRQKPLRGLFFNPHFYLGVLLSLIIFSPVLYWNFKHDWVSFLYQLDTHSLRHEVQNVNFVKLENVVEYLCTLNFLILIIWQLRPQNIAQAPLGIRLQSDVALVFFWFIIYLCFISKIHMNWVTPMVVSLSLLCGYAYQTGQLKKGICFYLSFFIILDTAYVAYHIFYQKSDIKHEIAQYLRGLPYHNSSNEFLIGDGWTVATALYPAKGHPLPKTLSCSNQPDNQYQYWNNSYLREIQSNPDAQVWYFSTSHALSCLNKYFNNCHYFSKVLFSNRHKTFLRTYVCGNEPS